MKYSIVAAALFSSVLAAPGWGPPGEYGNDGSWGTSTVEVTTEVTVTSCAAYVTDCPAGTSAAPASSVPAAPSYPAGGWGTSAAPESSAAAPSYPAGGWGSSAAEVSSVVVSGTLFST